MDCCAYMSDKKTSYHGRLVPGWTAWKWAMIFVGLLLVLAGCLLAAIVSVAFNLAALGAIAAVCTVVTLLVSSVVVLVQARKDKLEARAGYSTIRATERTRDLADVDPKTGLVIRPAGAPVFANSAERNAARDASRKRVAE